MNGQLWKWALPAASLSVTLLSLWLLARAPAPPAPPFAPARVTTCQTPPRWQLTYQLEDGGVRLNGTTAHFGGVGIIGAQVCGPGTLKLRGRGQAADGAWPDLTVSLDHTQLRSAPVHGDVEWSVQIPAAGFLTLGYFNDFYRAEVRLATLKGFTFTAPDCPEPAVMVPAATGGQFFVPQREVSLSAAVPMTVTLCAPGTLTLRLLGQSGQGEYPVVRFEQDGQTLKNVTTRRTLQALSINAQAGPLTIRMLNPYFRELANRDLTVEQLTFTPKTP